MSVHSKRILEYVSNEIPSGSINGINTVFTLSAVTNDAQIKSADFPGSSTNGNVATFNGTSGKSVQDSGKAHSIDGTLAANSDNKIPTEKAVKTYVDNKAILPGNFQFAESAGESSTTSATYQDKTTLTFTPPVAGDYLIMVVSSVANSNADKNDKVNIDLNGSSIAEYTMTDKFAYPDFTTATHFFKRTFTATSQTIKIQWKASANTSYIRNARITAWRVA